MMLHNVNCQQPFSICNKWFTLVGLIVGGSHAKVGGTRNQIASITVLHPCPLAQLTGKILNNRHQSRNTKKAMVAVLTNVEIQTLSSMFHVLEGPDQEHLSDHGL